MVRLRACHVHALARYMDPKGRFAASIHCASGKRPFGQFRELFDKIKNDNTNLLGIMIVDPSDTESVCKSCTKTCVDRKSSAKDDAMLFSVLKHNDGKTRFDFSQPYLSQTFVDRIRDIYPE